MDLGTASQTEWNGGTLTNIRIHDIREELRLCAMNKDLSNWLMLLVKLNHELYGFEDDKEKKDIRLELQKLASKINEHMLLTKNPRYRLGGIPFTLIDELNNMEYKLDEIFHKSGLQTALKEDAGDSF